MRRSEILGIKWSSIDWLNRTLTISHKVVPVNEDGKCRLEKSDVLKNKSSYRTLPLNDFLYSYLLDIKSRQDENKAFAGNSYNSDYDGYVCVNDMGNIIRPNYISKKFKELLQSNSMRIIRFHDLRHSCASLLLHLGYDMKNIQVWLGHGDIGTTMNIYAHVEAASKKIMIDDIGNALRKV